MLTLTSPDGTLIAYEISGSGPPLIVVNGALSDRHATDALRLFLDGHFSVVGYDRRGRGDSGMAEPSAREREIEDLGALIQAVGGRARVFGHSSGGMIALRAAAAGAPIERMVVNEPPWIVGETRRLPPKDIRERLGGHLAEGRNEDAVVTFMTDAVGVPPHLVEGMRANPAWPRLITLAPSTLVDMTMVGDSRAPLAALGRIHVPTLVLHGSASYPWIGATAELVAKTIPGAEYQVLQGQQHAITPEVLATVLIRFLGA